MKTNPLRIVILLVWAAILAVLVVAGTHPAAGQASKQVLSVPTMADLEARIPQTPSETIEVQHGSSSNRWAAPRLFVLATSSETADRVYVVTNRTAGTRYIAADRSNGVFDVRHFGAIPNVPVDSTPAITAAAAALQAAGGGTLLASGGRFLVRGVIGPVASFTGLSGLKIKADDATFWTDDLADSTFLAASFTIAGTTSTVTTVSAHGLAPGNLAVVKSATDAGYDGPYTVATTPSSNTFTMVLSGYSTPTVPATGLVRKAHYYSELFRFTTCTNVDAGRITFEGTIHPLDIQYRLGWIVANVRMACRGVKIQMNAQGVAYGVYCGDYDTPANGDSRGLNVEVDANDLGYPVSLANSGHDSKYLIRAERVHRGMYAAAVKRATIEAWIKDYEPAGVLVGQDPGGGTLVGSEDVDVTIHDTGTSQAIKMLAVGGTRYVFTLAGYSVAQPATHRNIRVRIFGKNIPDASLFQILTYDPQHTVDGFQVSGFVDNRGLALEDVRNDFYVDQKAATSGVFRDISIRDLTILSPASVGSYTARFHVTNLLNDLVVDHFETGQPKNFLLPPGRSVATVAAMPGWDFESFEQGLLANKANGARLNNTTLRHTLASELGAGDFTLLWAGTIPYDGNPGLFALGSATNGVSPSGLGLSLTNADLQLRFFGSTSNDWRALTVTNWHTAYQLKQASLVVVRDINGVRLYADGRQLLAGESTNGTPPAWKDSLSGTNWLIGTESIGTTYAGTVLKIGAWNYARSDDLPELASGFGTGQSSVGESSAVVDSSTLNGGMETAGGGGADVLANWSEDTAGSSTVTSSAVARSGSASVAFNVDSGNSIAGISQTGIATVGQTYRLSVWVRNQAGTGGAISIVGASDGESIQQLTSSTNWQQFTLTKVWGDTTLVIKRADGANRTFLVDDVEFKAVGSLADLDYTLSPQDRVTGRWAEVRGGAASGIRVRDAGVSSDRGDASVTLRAGHDAPVQLFATAITGARVVTFATDHVRMGDAFRIVRTGAGAGTLTAASLAIAADEWADFAFNGSAWQATAHGKITGTYSGGGGTNTWKIEANGVEVVEPDITDTSTIEWTAVGSVLSGAIKAGSIGTNLLTGAAYSALKDLGTATGTLAGSAVGSGINDDNVDFDDADGLWTATTLGAALEELNDSINAGLPNGTGAKVHWSQLLGVPAGFADGTDDGTGGGGNADTNAANAWGALQTFVGGIDASTGTNDLGVLRVSSIESDAPIGQSIGGTGGTNAESARSSLGVIIGTDVQAYDANLKQLATVSWASGDVPYFDGSNLTNLATTAAGRTLLSAANAAAQWSALLSSATTNGAYNSSTWDGITDRVPNLDQIRDAINALPGGSNSITSVNTNYFTMTGGYLDWIGGAVGGGSGYTYLLTNVGGAFQSRADGTNWVVLSTTISSNYAPSAAGRFLEGGYGLVLSNYSGTSANTTMRIKVNGSTVFRDNAGGLGSGTLRTVNNQFLLIRESDTTASLLSSGVHISGNANEGIGDFGGSSPLGFGHSLTNITWNWATNNTLDIAIECETSTSTNAALGVRMAHAYLRAEGAAGSGTGDVVGPASSTDSVVALYDGTTGKLLKNGTLTEAAINAHLTEAEASALYQGTNSVLTTLATLNGSALTNMNASNLASGTVSSNRLPSAIALTTIDAGTITATSVTGDGSGLTNLNGSNIASGTVADARIDSAITRDSEAAAAYQPLDADLTTLAINNGVNLTNINATIAFGTGTIPDARIGAAVARTNSPTLHSPSLLGDPTAPTASANDNDTSIATTAYVQAEETALKAANLWQATNANLTTLAGASITGSGNFMRTRTGVPREIWIPASAMNPGSDAPTPATNAWNTTTDGQRWEGWDFSATATNSVYFTLALPTAWDGGTVKAKILWKQVVAAATATNSWQIGGGSLTDGETGGNTLGTLVEVLDVGANDTNVVSVSSASGAITIGGTPSAGHLTWFTVRRHPGDDDDNFAQLSRLIGVHLQYTETSTEPSAW